MHDFFSPGYDGMYICDGNENFNSEQQRMPAKACLVKTSIFTLCSATKKLS